MAIAMSSTIANLVYILLFHLGNKDRKYPFFDKEDPAGSFTYAFSSDMEAEKYMATVHEYVRSLDLNKKAENRIMLLCEELPLLIKERNKKKVLLECSIIPDEDITIIFKDDGINFDISEDDLDVTSLRSYFVNVFVKRIKHQYITTLGFNRSIYTVKRNEV